MSHRHLSDHLSDLVENVLADLEKSKMIDIGGEDETQLEGLNWGMIASYYYLNYSTIELFVESLTGKTRPRYFCRGAFCYFLYPWGLPVLLASLNLPDLLLSPTEQTPPANWQSDQRALLYHWRKVRCGVQGLLEIISAASEFDELAVRPGEENLVQRLLKHAKFGVSNLDYTNPHTKVNALVQVRLRMSSAGC